MNRPVAVKIISSKMFGNREVTTPGTVMGEIGYMSPKQLTAEPVDARSDLFSVGVRVVEALTWRRPFKGTRPHD